MESKFVSADAIEPTVSLLTYGVGPLPHSQHKVELLGSTGQGLPVPGRVAQEQGREAVVLGEDVAPMADRSVLGTKRGYRYPKEPQL